MKTKITLLALLITAFSFAQKDINYKAVIKDVLGKRILNFRATNQLNIEDYKAGIYFLKVHTTTGKITKKLVIE